MYNPKTYVITGGTGSLGTAMVKYLLNQDNVDVIRIFSRDELKQHEMQKSLKSDKLRFFIGDVRDEERLNSAFRGADVVIHAAAMKQVPACEYNPYEAVQTNIIGTHNVISACVKQRVNKAMFISTDKAVNPKNLYGATKLVAEKLWLNSNKKSDTLFSVCRWGNVVGSRGSVIPLFKKQAKKGVITITDREMTRFWITLDEAVKFLYEKLSLMQGGDMFIPKLKSAKILDLAKIIAPKAKIEFIVLRECEKIHETLDGKTYSNECLMSKQELKKLYESI
jgi:UDP-N-acetylglucosamine 4,6-dehydratase